MSGNDPIFPERPTVDLSEAYVVPKGDLVILRVPAGTNDMPAVLAAARAAVGPDHPVLLVTDDVRVVRSEMADACYRLGAGDAREALESARPFIEMIVKGEGMAAQETAQKVLDAIDEVLEGGAA